MPAIRVVVSGYVQGVGFRAYVVREARRLGVRGSVWNRSDGKVELVAEHEDEKALGTFVARVWVGPGRVSDVQVTPGVPIGEEDFSIVHGE